MKIIVDKSKLINIFIILLIMIDIINMNDNIIIQKRIINDTLIVSNSISKEIINTKKELQCILRPVKKYSCLIKCFIGCFCICN